MIGITETLQTLLFCVAEQASCPIVKHGWRIVRMGLNVCLSRSWVFDHRDQTSLWRLIVHCDVLPIVEWVDWVKNVSPWYAMEWALIIRAALEAVLLTLRVCHVSSVVSVLHTVVVVLEEVFTRCKEGVLSHGVVLSGVSLFPAKACLWCFRVFLNVAIVLPEPSHVLSSLFHVHVVERLFVKHLRGWFLLDGWRL